MSDTRPPAPVGRALADAGRRVLGLVLVGLVAVPVFRILDPADFMSGLMSAAGAEAWRATWAGFAIVFAIAAGVAVVSGDRIGRLFEVCGRLIARPPTTIFAVGLALAGAALTAAVAVLVLDGRTVLNDASVQLVQARYFAAGRLAGPVLPLPEFWSIQFMVHTAAGWVSQYPPGHAALLAGGFVLGAPWLTMAAATGAMGALLTLSLERLFGEPFALERGALGQAHPGRVALARVAAVLATASPLLVGLAAGYMSHATLAAGAALALYLGLRAEDGALGWAAAAGAAVGLMVTLRPVTGLLLGATLTVGVWIRVGVDGFDRARLGRRLAAWAAGGAPFAVAFGWFNDRFFGSPLTLGYVAASGPNHGLGFHEDPWGRAYTFTDAVGNTSAELVALGRELLGAPVPIAAVIGVFLIAAPKLERAERVLLAWAVLPLLASALYWHHDLVFGPRMLGEAVPAWCALAAVAASRLPGLTGARWPAETLRLTALLLVVFALAGGGAGRLARLGARAAPYPPPAAAVGPALVFVHEPWADRLGGRLSARGLRLDSVRTLLTRFNPCQLEAGLAGITEGEAVPRCRREQASDRLGALGVTGLLWSGDLPGLSAEGPMWVRDLGPERNAALIERFPGRAPRFVLPAEPGAPWRVVPYDRGIEALWSDPGEAAASPPDPPSAVDDG